MATSGKDVMNPNRKALLEKIAAAPQPFASFGNIKGQAEHNALYWLIKFKYITCNPDISQGYKYTLTSKGKAALGISDEPQAAVVIETPAAPDNSVGGFEVGDVVTYQDVSIHTGKLSTKKTTIKRFSGKLAVLKTGKIIRTKDLTFVSRPTIATVAITDVDAVDTTPSVVEREISQPSGYDKYIPAKGDVAYRQTITGLYVHGTIGNQDESGLYTFTDDYGFTYALYADELMPMAPATWTDALLTPDVIRELATVNTTSEAIANDDYLPPTADEDYDSLPFSDNGQDEYTLKAKAHFINNNWYSIAQHQQENIASLEARVKELESIILELRRKIKVAYGVLPYLNQSLRNDPRRSLIGQLSDLLDSVEQDSFVMQTKVTPDIEVS